jgi:predicted O-methyltransferase YrrM
VAYYYPEMKRNRRRRSASTGPAMMEQKAALAAAADQPAIEVAPIVDVPFAKIDLGQVVNPFPEVLRSPEFSKTKSFFAESPSSARALSSVATQALLYSTVRNACPHHIVDIGTYNGGIAEALARGIQQNGHGTLHTGSPFDAARFLPVYHRWPQSLRRQVRYYQVDSMAFLMRLDRQGIRPDIVYIDGNHEVEFVTFDLQASARRLRPGGFIFVDNVTQAGPYLAAMDFAASHPEWTVCSTRSGSRDATKAFDRGRAVIADTDLIVFRAPAHYFLRQRPMTFGECSWSQPTIAGLKISIAAPNRGKLHAQCILRGFSNAAIEEVIGEAAATIDDGMSKLEVAFAKPIGVNGDLARFSVESWFVWLGDRPLAFDAVPQPF